jgi:hypothetical protein
MLIRIPFHVQVVAAEVIVMPRSCSCSLVHLSDTVRDARIEQDALGRRRLPGVDVSHDADVPTFCESYCACHGDPFLPAKLCPALCKNFSAAQPAAASYFLFPTRRINYQR